MYRFKLIPFCIKIDTNVYKLRKVAPRIWTIKHVFDIISSQTVKVLFFGDDTQNILNNGEKLQTSWKRVNLGIKLQLD